MTEQIQNTQTYKKQSNYMKTMLIQEMQIRLIKDSVDHVNACGLKSWLDYTIAGSVVRDIVKELTNNA